jgi:hypothetical protein
MRLALLATLWTTLAHATPSITIYGSLGPTPDSPGYQQFLVNLTNGIQNGGQQTGAAGPAQWNPGANAFPPSWILWDDGWAFAPFFVWKGEQNPATPFEAESGTWLYLSAYIAGNGTPVTLAGLTISSTWLANSVTYTDTDVYSSEITGFLGGIPVNSAEPGDTFVDEIILRGPGIYLDISCANLQNANEPFCAPGLTDQERYDLAMANIARFIGNSIDITYAYSPDISAQYAAQLVPEPSTVSSALGAIVLLGSLAYVRSRTFTKT